MSEQSFMAPGVPSFNERLCIVSNFLPPHVFSLLKDEILKLVDTERSYLPTQKKGGTVGYEALRKTAPKTVALYHDAEYQRHLSNIVGVDLQPTPLRDNSSLSILFYDRPGDHIQWHYDRNFYRGRHFTVLIGIENTNKDGTGLSAARLVVKKKTGEEMEIPTPANTLVLFEGAYTLHRVTPVAEGERRIILSMTYCTDPHNSPVQEFRRRIKDIAFFGLRALWD